MKTLIHKQRIPGGSRNKTLLTIGYYVAFVVLGLRLGSLGPTLPGLADNTNTSFSQVSSLFIAHAIGYLIGSLQGGKLYDRFSGNKVLAAMISAMAITTFVVPIFPDLRLLVVCFLILGIVEATIDVGGNTLLIWVHGEKVAPFLNGLYFWVAFGALMSPIMIAYILSKSGTVSLVYSVLGLLILPAALLLFLSGSPHIQKTVDEPSSKKSNGTLLIILISMFLFLTVGSSVGLDSWIYTYVVETGLGNEKSGSFITAVYWGTLLIGRLLAVLLTSKINPRKILFTNVLGCIVSIGLILLFPNSFNILFIGICGLGLSMSSLSPVTFSMAERLLPISGRTTGWFVAGISAGCMFIPWIIGQFFESSGPIVTMITILSAVIVALCVLIILFIVAQKRSKHT